MKRSTERIFTTHTGSLSRPAEVHALLYAQERGEPFDQALFGEKEMPHGPVYGACAKEL
jgi:hypothetical protein